MASLKLTLQVAAQPAVEFEVTPTDARTVEFLDDLITYYGAADRQDAALELAERTVKSIVRLAKNLKQKRLDEMPTVADDLEGN